MLSYLSALFGGRVTLVVHAASGVAIVVGVVVAMIAAFIVASLLVGAIRADSMGAARRSRGRSAQRRRLRLEHGLLSRIFGRSERRGALGGSRLLIIQKTLPLVMVVIRQAAGVELKSATQFGHDGGRFGLFELFAIDSLVDPGLIGPFHKAQQLTRSIGGFVLTGKSQILDLALV